MKYGGYNQSSVLQLQVPYHGCQPHYCIEYCRVQRALRPESAFLHTGVQHYGGLRSHYTETKVIMGSLVVLSAFVDELSVPGSAGAFVVWLPQVIWYADAKDTVELSPLLLGELRVVAGESNGGRTPLVLILWMHQVRALAAMFCSPKLFIYREDSDSPPGHSCWAATE